MNDNIPLDLPEIEDGQNASMPQSGSSPTPPNTGMPGINPAAIVLPDEASDIDLIEKEWVLKAKHIVAETMHDPYAQQYQISHMKADYMRKRYNKDLQTPDGA